MSGIGCRSSACFHGDYVAKEILPLDSRIDARGIGLYQCIDLTSFGAGFSDAVQKEALANRLVVDVCGRGDLMIKIQPAFTIEEELLTEGLERLKKALETVLK